jgi:hypothetical protein
VGVRACVREVGVEVLRPLLFELGLKGASARTWRAPRLFGMASRPPASVR